MNIFHTIFYQPLLNVLILLYGLVPGQDFGMAVLLLTLFIRILLFPLNLKSIKSQKTITKLGSELQKIRKKFKGDKEKITKETLALYQREKINPLSGFFLILIQLPILFALYKVFSKGISIEEWKYLYSFVPNPGAISPKFLMIDLAQPDFLLAGLASVLQFFQTKMQSGKTKSGDSPHFSQMFQEQMLYFFPVFTFFILLKIPSAIALYLVASTIFSIFQILYIQKTT